MIAVHPSREPKLMAGYATVALEMLDQAAQPLDTLFVPVGGGSLAAGMGLVYHALSPHTRLIGVQSAAAPALARAWQTGEMREFPVTASLADGLATRVPAPETVAILREVLDDIIEVSEAQIADAIRCFAETLHQMAEGAGAAALAGAMRMHRRLAGERVGVVLSGGNITSQQLSHILHGELLPREERSAFLAAQLSDMDYGLRGN
jgi:threonine dehydratase